MFFALKTCTSRSSGFAPQDLLLPNEPVIGARGGVGQLQARHGHAVGGSDPRPVTQIGGRLQHVIERPGRPGNHRLTTRLADGG